VPPHLGICIKYIEFFNSWFSLVPLPRNLKSTFIKVLYKINEKISISFQSKYDIFKLMSKKIAVILQARLNSQRCKNKMLRKFGDTTLFELQLKKLNNLSKKSNHNFFNDFTE